MLGRRDADLHIGGIEMKAITPILAMSIVLVLCMSGCKLTTTIELEEQYDVRIVNRSGERVKVRWAGDSYRYLDDGCIISILVDGGYYELEWADASTRRHTRPKRIFKIEVEADIDIVFRDDPDIIIIDR
jgi:hypothetical protein